MRYVCLGYHDDRAWDALSESDRKAILDETLAYQEQLRTDGHYVDGKALQSAKLAATLRFDEAGRASVTDGPFAETKEQLGGLMVLEARDLNDAIRLMSRLPCMRVGGSLEIRPINEDIPS